MIETASIRLQGGFNIVIKLDFKSVLYIKISIINAAVKNKKLLSIASNTI
jgi:hypothetical protein